jgi:hypothetical protein
VHACSPKPLKFPLAEIIRAATPCRGWQLRVRIARADQLDRAQGPSWAIKTSFFLKSSKLVKPASMSYYLTHALRLVCRVHVINISASNWPELFQAASNGTSSCSFQKEHNLKALLKTRAANSCALIAADQHLGSQIDVTSSGWWSPRGLESLFPLFSQAHAIATQNLPELSSGRHKVSSEKFLFYSAIKRRFSKNVTCAASLRDPDCCRSTPCIGSLLPKPGLHALVSKSQPNRFSGSSLVCRSFSVNAVHKTDKVKRSVALWGNADFGRLGHGNYRATEEPVICEALEEHSIKQVACGGAHSVVVTGNV